MHIKYQTNYNSLPLFSTLPEMNHFSTPISAFDYSITPSLIFGNASSSQLPILFNASIHNATPPPHSGPPESVYNFTQQIILGIVFGVLSLLTVIGNFMVRVNFLNFIMDTTQE